MEPRGDVHIDHLATPRSMTNSSGAEIWRSSFEAFGGHQQDPASAVELAVRLPGQSFHSEGGLYNNRFRNYDAAVGRYVSADPIGQLGGVNLVAYAGTGPRLHSIRLDGATVI